MNGLLKSSIAALILVSPGMAAAAGWKVNSEESRLAFVTVKADTIAEVHHFTRLDGTVSEDGAARIVVPLDTIETNADIRNERMRDFLFETVKFPDAVITADLDMEKLKGVPVGQRVRMPLAATVDMHGRTLDIEPEVFVTRVADTRVSVETVEPLVVEAFDFEFEAGVDKLQELAGLPSITPAVPVTFTLMFDED